MTGAQSETRIASPNARQGSLVALAWVVGVLQIATLPLLVRSFSSLPPLIRPASPLATQSRVPQSTTAFVATNTRGRRFAKRAADDEDEDVPPDWNEDEILAEFDDVTDTELDVDEDEVDVADDTEGEAEVTDEDDDLDDEDIDEIALDLDEDDEDDDGDEDYGQDVNEVEEDAYKVPVGEFDAGWDDEEDGGDYQLEDDTENPDYMRQKELVEEAVRASNQRAADENFDPLGFIQNDMTDDMAKALDELPFIQEAEQLSASMMLTDDDVETIDLDKAVAEVSDLMTEDPYPRYQSGERNFLEENIGVSDDDMERLDGVYKQINEKLEEEPWDKVNLKDQTGWDSLTNETLAEMEDCLEEIGGSAYNVTRWLLYDLDFNVSNLILAAVKHNPQAPVLLQHWYPQLVTYARYQHSRDRDFDFNWEDVENADLQELEHYYAGFGYKEIPKKAPAETGIISLEDLDEEEIKMAALERWMTDVYNPEWDRKDFDDDDMQDEDNVFSQFYEAPQHPDLPTFADAVEDIEQWKEEMGDEPSNHKYRDMMGKTYDYKVVRDEEFEREFRGHLIIACTGQSTDLEVAERITERFEQELGKKVFVETRIMNLAREEDNVFEIWLESYEIDLLHSKKRATANAEDWDGPVDCDEAQIEYLVDRVRFLISDEVRYSYRMELEHTE